MRKQTRSITNYSDELEGSAHVILISKIQLIIIDFDLNLGISPAQQEFLSEKVAREKK